MADFSDVVKELKQTNSKLDRLTKSGDPSGPVMAAESEEKREEETRDIKENQLLERIAVAVEKFGPGGIGDGKGKKGLGMMDILGGQALFKLLGQLGKVLGLTTVGALLTKFGIGGLVVAALGASILAVKDGMDAWSKAEKGKWGSVDKISAFIGGFFGGNQAGSLWNSLNQAWKIGAMGGMAGFIAAGPPGMIAGFIIGAAIGAISGYFGSKKVADWIDSTVKFFRDLFDLPELLSDAQIKAIGDENKAIETREGKLLGKIGEYNKISKDQTISNEKRVKTLIALQAAETELQQGRDKIDNNIRRLRNQELALKDKEISNTFAATQHARLAADDARQLETDARNKWIWIGLTKGFSSDEAKTQSKIHDAFKDNTEKAVKHHADLLALQKKQETERVKIKEKLDKEHGSYIHNFMMAHSGLYRWAQESHKEEVSQVKKDQDAFKAFFEETIPNIWKTWVTDGQDRIKEWNKISKDQEKHKPAALYGDWDKFFDNTLPDIWKTWIMNPLKDINDWRKEKSDAQAVDAKNRNANIKHFFLHEAPEFWKTSIMDPIENAHNWMMANTGKNLKLNEKIISFLSGLSEFIPKFFYDPGHGPMPGGKGRAPARFLGVDMTFLHKLQDIADRGELGKTLIQKWNELSDMIVDLLPKWITDPIGWFKNLFKAIETPEMSKEIQADAIRALENRLKKPRGVRQSPAAYKTMLGEIQKQLDVLKGVENKQFGGMMGPGDLALVGEGGTELFVSDRAGTILSAGLTRQIFGQGGGAGANIVSAPTVVNAPQSSMTMVGAPIVNDNPILRAVNASALT